MSRAAVVGHVGWSIGLRVDSAPAQGQVTEAKLLSALPAGAAVVPAIQAARLGVEVDLYTAVSDDDLGCACVDALEQEGIMVHAATRPQRQRQALVHVDREGERTITVLGERLAPLVTDALPWERLEETDAVLLTAADADTVRRVVAAPPMTIRYLQRVRTLGRFRRPRSGSSDDRKSLERPLPAGLPGSDHA